MIFGIKPFEIHDGDGIRTTIFLKGCPLRCKWCHNPESFSFEKQLLLDLNKCTNCGKCSEVCNFHKIVDGKHFYNRNDCIHCGKCVEVCNSSALRIYGEEMTVDEIVNVVKKDELFLKECKGGVTLSGGEPLMQPHFCLNLLKSLKEKGFNTAVDTSCYVDESIILKVLPYVDEFLIDIKAINKDVHIKCTGVDNEKILKNIRLLDEKNKKIEIRYPYVPGMNDGEVRAIGEFVSSLKNTTKIKVLPYHNYAKAKYEGLGIKNLCEKTLIPTSPEIDDAVAILKSMKCNVVTN